MIDACAWALLEDELDYASDFYEWHGELMAQYNYEMGVYGDAWPGAAREVANSTATVEHLDSIAATYRALTPPLRPLGRVAHLTDDVF